MQNIKNIILDYGNVVFMIDFKKAQDAFEQLGVENVTSVFAHKQQNELFDLFDKGAITKAQFRDGIRKITENYSLQDQEIDDAWNALLVGVPKGKHDILRQLKARYRTFLLSNNNEIHYEYCMQHLNEKHNIENNDIFFEKAYYSHLMGMRKPDKEIFEHVLAQHGLIPKETLFVDDSPQHLTTAEKLGIKTVLCSKEQPLEVIVNKWNLLP